MLLTDCPELLESFFGAAPASIQKTTPPQSDLYEKLGGTSCWACTGWGLEESTYDLWLMRTCGVSQFDVLQQGLSGWSASARPLFVHAMTGQGFHGQRGRSWQALPGNLHISACLPAHLDPGQGPLLNAIPVLAACEALRASSQGRLDPRIKWINDTLIEDAKCAGSITAASIQKARITGVVFGTGINVAVRPEVPRSASVPQITCLRDHLGPATPPPGQVLLAYAEALLHFWGLREPESASALVSAYRAAASFVGRPGRLIAPESNEDSSRILAEGVVLGVDDQLGLQIQGYPAAFMGGRLVLL